MSLNAITAYAWTTAMNWIVTSAAAMLVLACPVGVFAQSNDIFKEADLALGRKLIAENQCDTCHAKKMEGLPNTIYRPNGRINAPGILRGMVEQCNTELNLALFPDEVTAIAAVLNRDHYLFK